MNAQLFLEDLRGKPDHLRALDIRESWTGVPQGGPVLLLGMGSSHYANLVAAARLRRVGVRAVAQLSSADLLPQLTPGTVVLAVSASGSSAETLDAVRRLRETPAAARCIFIAVTNTSTSPLAELSDLTVYLQAGEERGGVACRSFQHTLALLLALEAHLTGRPVTAMQQTIARAANASEQLLEGGWLDEVSPLLLGPDGTWIVAPDRRISSALQSALMLREGPRRPAVGCETGDWSHVEVYLTKTLDYRMLLLSGSRWEPELLKWTGERGSTVVAVGAHPVSGATYTLRYPHDDEDDVALLTETLVAELIAATAWLAQS
ncbi:MAG TPA: SIS domain-containing protein [Jatrophihabitans sp.]